jgi:hypothetical protein
MTQSNTEYNGQLTSDVRVQLTDLLKVVAVANLDGRTNIKRLCGIAIELLDNAQRYCSAGNVRLTWEVRGDELVICIENQAKESDARRLLTMVEAVNNMTPDQLSEAFRAQLTNGQFGEKGGAGLGFMEIARRSNADIRATITPVQGDQYICRSEVATKLGSK